MVDTQPKEKAGVLPCYGLHVHFDLTSPKRGRNIYHTAQKPKIWPPTDKPTPWKPKKFLTQYFFFNLLHAKHRVGRNISVAILREQDTILSWLQAQRWLLVWSQRHSLCFGIQGAKCEAVKQLKSHNPDCRTFSPFRYWLRNCRTEYPIYEMFKTSVHNFCLCHRAEQKIVHLLSVSER